MPGHQSTMPRYEAITYGNYTFDSYTKVTLNKQNIYSEDNLVVKYIRCTLEVELIIATTTVRYKNNGLYRSIDEEIDYIREELSSPNKELVIWYHGAGAKINIRGRSKNPVLPITPALIDGNPLTVPIESPYHVSTAIFEGPFPEVLTWEPLGANNSARCKWRCIFNIPVKNVDMFMDNATGPEDSTATKTMALGGSIINDLNMKNVPRQYAGQRTIEDVINNYFYTQFYLGERNPSTAFGTHLLSHSEEQEFEVDEDGTAVMTLTGVLEFTSTGIGQLTNSATPAAVPRLLQLLTHYFEPLHPPGFTRTQKYKFRKSKREIEYTIIDREQKSDNPMFPTIVKADVSHTVSSNLLGSDPFEGQGFRTWNNVFDGTITVRPGVWKGWAWIAMMNIIRQRMYRTAPFTGETFGALKDSVSAIKPDTDTELKKIEAKHLLHKISIKENIYNRETSFNMSYMVVTNLNQLFFRTGLFYPVHIAWNGFGLPAALGITPEKIFDASPLPYNQQWDISNEHLANTQNVFGYRGPLLPGYDMVFNPYDGWDPNREAKKDAPRNPEGNVWASNEQINFSNYPQANVDTFGERRRNSHLEVFKDNKFPHPEGNQNTGGPAPLKEAVGQPSRSATDIGTGQPVRKYATFDPLQDPNYLAFTDPKQTWVSYDTKFIMHRKENSVMFPSISSEAVSTRQSELTAGRPPAASLKGHTGFSILGSSNASPSVSGYEYSDIQAFGKAVTYVQFTGRAIRVGYPIPCPVLVGCKNNGTVENPDPAPSVFINAYRVGESQYSCYQIAQSADLPVFQANWNILYALKGDPACANIDYIANRNTDYA